MRTLAVVYPKVMDIGCFSHTIDQVGDHFKTPILSEFSTSWIMLFSHSPKVKLLWKEQTRRSVTFYSATRWWSRWEVYHQLLLQFGDIELFLQRHDDLGPTPHRRPHIGDPTLATHISHHTSPTHIGHRTSLTLIGHRTSLTHIGHHGVANVRWANVSR